MTTPCSFPCALAPRQASLAPTVPTSPCPRPASPCAAAGALRKELEARRIKPECLEDCRPPRPHQQRQHGDGHEQQEGLPTVRATRPAQFLEEEQARGSQVQAVDRKDVDP